MGYIVYLKVAHIEQVACVFEVFSKYKTLYKNCVVAVSKKSSGTAVASPKRKRATRIPVPPIAPTHVQNNQFQSFPPSPARNVLPVQQNTTLTAENYGPENSYNSGGTQGTVQLDHQQKMSSTEEN